MRVRAKLFLAVAAAMIIAPAALRSDCTLTSVAIAPLPDAGPRFYKGFQRGLYSRGGNARPPTHAAAGLALAGQIQPLDASGAPNAATGKIVLISVGMSNTTQEFSSGGSGAFLGRANADPAKNPQLVIVDGAQGGRDANLFTDPNAATWQVIDSRLAAAGVTPQQVQVAWVKQSLQNIPQYGAFPAHAQTLQSAIETIARNIKTRYPNTRIAYYSSRTRSYNGGQVGTNPEPYSFEVGFSTKWMIEKQIAGSATLNFDPARGAAVAPWLAWGPYLWIDGTTPRSDALTWPCSDLQTDFTHPSQTGGVPKVADQLLAFFKTDPSATPWFLKRTVAGQPPTVSASANVTSGAAPLNVNFSASATDPDGTIVGYQWTFDDGTSATAQNPAKTFPAPGTYHARLTVTDNSGNAVQRTIPIDVRLSLAEWKRVHFTTAEQADPTISGDSADPDRDGANNRIEYGLGLLPKTPDAAKLPVAGSSPDRHLTLTFPRAKAAADVNVIPEVASELNGPWGSGASATSEQVIADDGVVQTIISTDLVPMSGNGTRFMRLRIDKLSPPAATAFHTATMTPQQSMTRALEP